MRSKKEEAKLGPNVLILDIDGVLTDGTDRAGGGEKSVFLRDLDAMARIRKEGVKVAFLTGEEKEVAMPIVDRCGGGIAVFGAKDKGKGIRQLARRLGESLENICYIGDADRDADAMKLVGLALAPADASALARATAHRVLFSLGGRGAVEEAVALVFGGDRFDITDLCMEIRGELEKAAKTIEDFAAGEAAHISEVAAELIRCIRARGKVFIFGNGGSAAVAQHFAAELVSRFSTGRHPVPAVALTTDTSKLTALANDFGFESVFERQVAVEARYGDVVIGMSTTGTAENVARGLTIARAMGARTIALVGEVPGAVGAAAQVCVTTPTGDPDRTQELHLIALHAVCRQLNSMDLGASMDSLSSTPEM